MTREEVLASDTADVLARLTDEMRDVERSIRILSNRIDINDRIISYGPWYRRLFIRLWMRGF